MYALTEQLNYTQVVTVYYFEVLWVTSVLFLFFYECQRKNAEYKFIDLFKKKLYLTKNRTPCIASVHIILFLLVSGLLHKIIIIQGLLRRNMQQSVKCFKKHENVC